MCACVLFSAWSSFCGYSSLPDIIARSRSAGKTLLLFVRIILDTQSSPFRSGSNGETKIRRSGCWDSPLVLRRGSRIKEKALQLVWCWLLLMMIQAEKELLCWKNLQLVLWRSTHHHPRLKIKAAPICHRGEKVVSHQDQVVALPTTNIC